MRILAFDTSTKFLSVALLEDERKVSEFHEEAGIRHSEILITTIKNMLEGSGWEAKDIDLVCVGIGPGSFTGLRIAVATAKGLAAVLRNKVSGIPTMDAMIMNLPPNKTLMAPLLDARKAKVYSCIYDRSGEEPERITEYLLVTIEELLDGLKRETIFFGDAVIKYKEVLDKHPLARYIDNCDWYPRAVQIGRMALRRLGSGTDTPESLEPLYLHAKECNITTKKKK